MTKKWETNNDILKAANDVYGNSFIGRSDPETTRSQALILEVALKAVEIKIGLAKHVNHQIETTDEETKSLPDFKLF